MTKKIFKAVGFAARPEISFSQDILLNPADAKPLTDSLTAPRD